MILKPTPELPKQVQ